MLFSAVHVHAGDKKKEPLLNKAEELTADDEKDTKLTNSPRKVYTVKLVENKTYQMDLKSKDFDAVLRVEDSAGKEVAFNDDAPGLMTLDSRIIYKAPKSGEYKIIATCLDGKPGKYSVAVVEVEGGATVSIFKEKGVNLALKDGKGKYEGELNTDDPVAQNHYYKLFLVKMDAGKTYRIDHMSDDFDAYLFLEDPSGNKLAQDDDGGDGLNSRIVYKAAKSGVYRIIATTLPARKTGKFVLEVTPASADEEKEAALGERVNDFATAAPAEQKKLLGEMLKYFQSKDGKLTPKDVQYAFMLAESTDDTDGDVARKTYEDYIKIFSAADNPQVAGVTKSFRASLKKLDFIGKEFPVAGKTVDGKDYDLKNMKGKVVLVDFWATWCGPCINELPNMDAAYKSYHKKGFDIVGISLDRPNDGAKLAKFIEDRKMAWPCINIEDSRELADKYDVNSIPFPVLVDTRGNVISVRARGPQLERLLERFLGKK